MKKKICPECDGNGYVRAEADPVSGQVGYRDCEECESQGEVLVAEGSDNGTA